MRSQNLYYRRTRRRDINLITDIQLLPDKEQPSPPDEWHKASLSLRSGLRGISSLFLWYKTGKTASQMTPEDKANLITELDVLYGDDVPWYGFERLQPHTMPAKGLVEPTWLTIRRGVKGTQRFKPSFLPLLNQSQPLVAPRAPPLHFSRSGNFKILQVADLHFSVSSGVCRDTDRKPCENSDNLTASLISHVLEAEKPDLVVFSGDQLNGQGTSWDPKSVLAKFSRAVTDKGIPWSAVFGNHDEEDALAKEDQVMLMKALPYSVVERGPKDVHGVGNYVLKVKSADAYVSYSFVVQHYVLMIDTRSMTHLLTLYFLDSGSYSNGILDWFGFFEPTAYDWIRQVC